MNKVIIIVLFLTGCSTSQYQNYFSVTHSNEYLGEFNEYWSSCRSILTSTTDNRWVISIRLPDKIGTYDASEIIRLDDLASYNDRMCQLSLYKNNDIQCESDKTISTRASGGDAHIELIENIGEYINSVRLSVDSLVFDHPEGKIVIDEITFPEIRTSNFCGG